MKLMRRLPDGSSVEVAPEDMTKDELERLGKFLRKMADEGKHPKGHDPETCTKFAGITCGVIGRDLLRTREIWREREAAHWGTKSVSVLVCPECGYQTQSATVLRRHEEADHATKTATTPSGRTRTYTPRKRAATTTTRTRKTVLFENVAEGDYALPTKTQWEFFKVQVPTKGRWTNYRFIRKFDTADGKFHRVADRDTATDLLDRISKDPARASADFKKFAPTTVKIAEVVW